MNGLALCAGIAGIELGLKLVLGNSYHTVCYVEREAYNAETLAARMEDGYLEMAPIWDDLKSFDGQPWRGIVDIVTSGLPCQPFSLAGKRKRESDERHLWPEIKRIIEECKPTLVFLENVQIDAFREPYRDLQAMGFALPDPYAATAAEMGAGHIRRRVFLLAHIHSQWGIQPQRRIREERKRISDAAWWDREPDVARLVSGLPYKVDRTRALGESCVPVVAAKAFIELIGML